MTNTLDQPSEMTQTAPGRKLPWIVAVLVVAIIVGATVAALAWGGDNHHNSAATTPPSVSWMQNACQQWMGTYDGTSPPGSWCASMGSWMQTSGGGTMGMMSWRDADQFRTACINRMGGTTDTEAWCNAMTTWMQQQASQHGGWGAWMMRPSP